MDVVGVVPGPRRHGVVRHGRDLAAAVGMPAVSTLRGVAPGTAVLLEFTDRLLGPTVERAAAAMDVLLRDLAGHPFVVAAHDVPAGDDWSPPRRALYARAFRAARGVVVCSATERAHAAALGAARLAVAPVPVRSPARRGPVAAPESVTVAGFVWPGKGHAEVLAAVDVLPPGVALVVAGEAAAGHDGVLAGLPGPVLVTGHRRERAFRALLRAPTVPVAPNRRVAASASIAAWWAAGRRPLVPDVPYIRELAARDPDALHVYDDLRPALLRAWADPWLTWLPAGCRPGSTVGQVAAIRLRAVREWCA